MIRVQFVFVSDLRVNHVVLGGSFERMLQREDSRDEFGKQVLRIPS
jgi:hypothetical protein